MPIWFVVPVPVKNGYLEFNLYLGDGKEVGLKSPQRVDDGTRHKLEVSKTGDRVQLFLDQREVDAQTGEFEIDVDDYYVFIGTRTVEQQVQLHMDHVFSRWHRRRGLDPDRRFGLHWL